MDSVNQLLADERMRHQVLLAQYGNGVILEMMRILNGTDADLFGELAKQLERLRPSEFTVQRLESMLGTVRAINAAALGTVNTALTKELEDLVQYETAYQAQSLTNFVPVTVHVASVNAEQVYAAVMAEPFQGTLLQGALQDVGARRSQRIQRAIAQGYVENKTNDQIIRELRGTRALGYADGLMHQSRRDVAAIVQTAVSHTAAFTHQRAVDANIDIIKALKWSSKLDLRTSPICRLRDDLLYTPVEHKPIGHAVPWRGGPGRAHWNCRSSAVEVLKSFKELGISAPEIMVRGKRASMDGQVPSDTSYLEWLKRQPAGRQDEVLGPTRGKLLRVGKLAPERMYGSKGQYLTLEELRERDAAAFNRANL